MRAASPVNCIYPVWNRKEFVKLSLASLDKYLDWSLIDTFMILDDHSEDGAYELCVEWAKGNDKVRVVRIANPTMTTGYALARGEALCTHRRWTLLMASDSYLCDDFMAPLVDMAAEPFDTISNRQLHRLPQGYTPGQLFNCQRVVYRHNGVTGGMMLVRHEVLSALRPIIMERGMNLTALFNNAAPAAGVRCRNGWPTPPFPMLYLDHDLVGSEVTRGLFARENLPRQKLLELAEQYLSLIHI